MKKIFISLLSVFALGAAFCGIASAQTSAGAPVSGGVLVATVNIYNAKIISQNDRDFSISFDISNRIGAQPQIKYAAELLDVSSNQLVDEKVYDEVLSLGENTTLNKTINYTVPSSIPAGSYNLYILSENESGLILAQSSLGKVNIAKSSASSVEIVPNSCELYANSELLASSSVVDSTSTITANCTVNSSYTGSVDLVPNFVTRANTSFGNIASTAGGSSESIEIKPGANSISAELPKASIPQNYYVAFSLASADNSIVSNTVGLNYNTSSSGPYGIINNVVFDKTFYKAGDTANIQVLTFANVSSTTVAISVLDSKNESCSNQVSVLSNSFTTIQVPIAKDCINPKANVTLSANGVVLDARNYQITTPENVLASSSILSIFSSGQFNIKTIAIIIVALIILIILFALIYKKNHSVINVIIFIILGISIFGFSGSVKADTYNYQYKVFVAHGVGAFFIYAYNLNVSVNLDKITYNPGDQIQANTSFTGTESFSCTGNVSCVASQGNVSGVTELSLGIDNANYISTSTSPSYLIAPSNTGSHNLYVKSPAAGSCGNGCAVTVQQPIDNSGSPIPFNVSSPVINLSLSANPTSVLTGASSTVSWNSSGADSCTLTKNGVLFVGSTPASDCVAANGTWDANTNMCNEFMYLASTALLALSSSDCTNLGGTVNATCVGGNSLSCTYYCSVPEANVPKQPYTSDSISSGPLTSDTTFNLTCSNSGNSVSTSTTVKVSTTQSHFSSPTCSATSQSITCQPVSSSTDPSYSCKVVDQSSGDQIASEINDGILTTTGALSESTTYVIPCSDNSGQLSQTSVNIPQSGLICIPLQSGSNNIYVNKAMTWTMPYSAGTSTITWSGTNVSGLTGNPVSKIYTTIGTKTITGQVVGSSIFCTGTTTVKIGTSTSSEF